MSRDTAARAVLFDFGGTLYDYDTLAAGDQEALLMLAKLAGADAPGADVQRAYRAALRQVFRSYLERRYVIRAPELTTEEFLQEAARSHALDDEHRARLGEFLERCDRVKFAGWRPSAEESLATLGGARAFVEETRVAAPAEPPEAVIARAA